MFRNNTLIIFEKYQHTKTRKSSRKLHIAIDEQGLIVVSELTCQDVSDCAEVPVLLKQIAVPIDTILADGAYDQIITYQAMEGHQKKYGNGLKSKLRYRRI